MNNGLYAACVLGVALGLKLLVAATPAPPVPDAIPCMCQISTFYQAGSSPPSCAASWGITISYEQFGICYVDDECELTPAPCKYTVTMEASSNEGEQCNWAIRGSGLGGGGWIFGEDEEGIAEDPSETRSYERACSEWVDGIFFTFYANGSRIGLIGVVCNGCGSEPYIYMPAAGGGGPGPN